MRLKQTRPRKLFGTWSLFQNLVPLPLPPPTKSSTLFKQLFSEPDKSILGWFSGFFSGTLFFIYFPFTNIRKLEI